MAQFFGIETIKELTKTSQTTLNWTSGSVLRIGGQAYNVTSVLILDTATDIDTGSVANDTIYYVYAVVTTGIVSLKYSLSNTAPTGFAAYRKIGAFQTDGSAEVIETSTKDYGSVGDIIQSMLTEEQFISENGAGWVLADGRDVTGSKYDTLILGGLGGTIPDMRGQFLRGLDTTEGVDPDFATRTLGSSQADEFASHTHFPTGFYNNGVSDQRRLGIFTFNNGIPRTGLDPTTASGGNETRPKNVAVNIFIKIEDIAV